VHSTNWSAPRSKKMFEKTSGVFAFVHCLIGGGGGNNVELALLANVTQETVSG